MAVYDSGSGLPPGTEHAGTLSLDHPAYRTVRNKSLLLISPPAHGLRFWQPEENKTTVLVDFPVNRNQASKRRVELRNSQQPNLTGRRKILLFLGNPAE